MPLREQSVRAPLVRYTELEEQGLVETLYEGDDLLRITTHSRISYSENGEIKHFFKSVYTFIKFTSDIRFF